VFNSRTCQLVLGAGALAAAGLKSITARHLALAAQALGAALALHPALAAAAAAAVPPPRRALLLPEFERVAQVPLPTPHPALARPPRMAGRRQPFALVLCSKRTPRACAALLRWTRTCRLTRPSAALCQAAFRRPPRHACCLLVSWH